MKEQIIKILNDAVYAPSGDNHQPWSFEVYNNVINIFNLPDRDKILYNFKQNGSYIAHGCLLENIIIASKEQGYEVNYTLFPDPSSQNLVCNVILKSTQTLKDPLYKFLKTRSTNRKKYESIKLDETKLNLFENLKNKTGRIVFTHDPSKQKVLGEIAAINEQILLESKTLHDMFFNNLVWTKEEEEEKKQGLYFTTLELKGPPAFLFKKFRNWNTLSFLNKFGISKFVAKQNSLIWGSGSLHGVIAMPDKTPKDYVETGRILQRLWLTVTSESMYLQPIGGTLYLARRLFDGESEGLTEKHQDIVKSAYKSIREIFNVADEEILLLFRIGFADPPSATSSRLPAQIEFKG